jgi:hypothetical protein
MLLSMSSDASGVRTWWRGVPNWYVRMRSSSCSCAFVFFAVLSGRGCCRRRLQTVQETMLICKGTYELWWVLRTRYEAIVQNIKKLTVIEPMYVCLSPLEASE